MRIHWRRIVLCVFVVTGIGRSAALADINHPFASHPMPYAAGSIMPGHLSQAALDQAVADFYDQWKAAYLEQTCGAGRYVVRTTISPGNLTVSEGHGYGMMLAALMAGHDDEAQDIFDGMYAYFREHPTSMHDHLMQWNQNNSCRQAQGSDSATDGDLDIAFALLLADKQWGSCGRLDYFAEALAVIEDVRDGEVDASASYTLLGDWVTMSDPGYYNSTRSSDFMVDHFASFADASGSSDWTDLRDSLYDIVASVQTNHSPASGLLPDFLINPATSPAPAPADFLEGDTDGSYAYNACRDPWRLATDFLVSGETRAKVAVEKINDWIRAATGDDPDDIGAGYELSGTATPGTDYRSMAFVAPFGVGAMVDSGNQAWLEDVWDLVAATPIGDQGYYENTLKLLSMLVMSGNWWAPESVGAPTCTPSGTAACTNGASLLGVYLRLKRAGTGAGKQQMKLAGTLFFPGGAPSVLTNGAQILVEDMGDGGAAIFDLSTATVAVPASAAPACDARDAWKASATKVRYRNKSGALGAPTCDPGSANGLSLIQYRTGSGLDVQFSLKAKRSTIEAPVGPVRVTLVLGATAAAGDDGECGVSAEVDCALVGSSVVCR